MRHRWLHISRLQFKARSPNFNAELIPVHSPLLRESCLVSYPPLTYMLKFSGFADLTSYQRISHAVGQVTPHNQPFKPNQPTNSPRVVQQQQAATIAFCQLRTARRADALHASRAQGSLVHRRGLPTHSAPLPRDAPAA